MSLPPPPPPGTPPPPPPDESGQPSGSWPGYGSTAGPRADFGYRLLGALIDGILLSIVNGILDAVTDRVVSTIIGLIVGLLYTTVLLGSPSGQTLGMRAVGIRMIDATTGGQVDYGRCVTRWVVAIASGLALGLGYLWMLWDPERQTWHDKAAGVYVVPVSAFPIPR